ncbi:MAG: T9SS type A sorting domain-containing protein, partial [Bacteroidales bacterium]|nr:T9SS type A sorting domain-containing protein [Bacteroidales bacterium]
DNTNVPFGDFNGWLYPTIYDKTDSVPTINPAITDDKKFPLQKSIIFKGKSKIENGYFSFSFMTPKDINYEYGMGKISYYAMEKGRDAKGYDTVLIGGMKDTIIDDNTGPEITLYFNDMEKKFVNGGLTSTTPLLHAKLADESGINTTGTGIGHDILATVDGDMSKSIVLNDFFEYDTNSFVSGSLSYLLSPLAEGAHTLTLRAWDIVNNMNEETINFEVVKDEDLKIKHVLNYPNPFTTSTQFFFEHNRPNTLLRIRVQVFTISGKIVWTHIESQQNSGFRSNPIPWNGLDDYGDKLARGIYIYKLQVMTPDGKSTEKIEKIAIL